ncbi:glycosyltransferase family 4 protein [Desulfobaculum senezii]|jgi:glycosyltransferase involved in cell wall biosynthesis
MKSQRIWGTLDPFYEGGAIMGRSVANVAFLRALLRADPFDEYHFFLTGKKQVDSVTARLAEDFPAMAEAGRFCVRRREALPAALAQTDYHAFHLSDCINYPAYLAALRNAESREIFPITGPTHSLSYQRYMRDFLAHLWPGTTPRDCVVATSRTAVDVVDGFYSALESGYGLRGGMRPTVRRIPLGVDADYYRPATSQERAAARASVDMDPDGVMLLVFARLSPYSKMDVLPLIRTLLRVRRGGMDLSKVTLCLGGWNDGVGNFPNMLREMARNIGVGWRLEESPSDTRKRELFWASDVFLSPVDNPQETFGLTLLEAGAMGVPVLASAYDGYRDLVVDGATGFLVPTVGPVRSGSIDRTAPLVADAEAHLHMAQQTAVDVAVMAQRLEALMVDAGLRQRMGAAARERVARDFSWDEVVRQHCALWDELWTTPVDREALRGVRHPMHLPYAELFGGYTTLRVDGDLRLVWSQSGQAVYRGRDFVTMYEGIERRISPEALRRLVFFARRPIDAAELVSRYAEAEGLGAEDAEFGVLWALKHDFLERTDV